MQEKLRPIPKDGIPRRWGAQRRGLGQRRKVGAFDTAHGQDTRVIFFLGRSWNGELWLEVRRRTSFSSTLGRSTRPSTLQRQALASRASAISLVPNWPRTSYLNDPRQLLPVLMTPDHPLYAFGICCTPDELDRWPVEVGWELRTQLWSRAKGNRILSGGIRHTLEPGRRTAPGNR
jgi:hypothetical protein